MRRPRRLLAALALGLALVPAAASAQDPGAAADSAWRAGEAERARALYAEILARDSLDATALHRTALLLAWDRHYGESLRLLDRLLAAAPADRDAAMSRARVLAWSGDLKGSEARWREVLAQDTLSDVALAGLAQTLRWQGRDAAARELLVRAKPPLPEEREIAAEMAWNRVAMRPRLASSFVFERDSDSNRNATFSATGTWRPLYRTQLRVDGYTRAAHGSGDLEVRARGATFGVWQQREPGWAFSAALGANGSNVPDADPFLAALLAVATPRRPRVGGGLTLGTGAFDATAALIESQVRISEATLDAWWRGVHWRLDGSVGAAALHSRVSDEDNTRTSGTVTLTRPLSEFVSLAARVRAFGYEKQLDDGYFDPDAYLLGELVARYLASTGPWALDLEGAPGVQRIETGPLTGSWRAAGRLGYALAPGRELALTLTWARSGANALSDAAAGTGYRYFAAGLAASWSF